MGAVEDRPDYDYADGVTLHVYRLPDGASQTVRIPVADPRQDAPAVTVRREAGVIRIEAAGALRNWQVLLAGSCSVGRVAGGSATPHRQGTLIRAAAATLEVQLGPG